MAARQVTVLIVDDHGVMREGLTLLLERSPHIRVVATAQSGTEGVSAAIANQPDIVLMDLVLPDLGGLDATKRIVAALPRSRVIILSMCATAEHVFCALRAGAVGYVLKQSAAAELITAINATMKGERYFSPPIAELGKMSLQRRGQSPMESLSSREREVLHLTVASLTSEQIAARLHISDKTVATYRSRIMRKLGVADRTALVRYALQHELTPP